MTPSEQSKFDSLMTRVERLKAVGPPYVPSLGMSVDEIGRALGGGVSQSAFPGGGYGGGHGPGDMLVASPGYKAIKDPASRPQVWSSGVIEIPGPLELKGTLTETTAGGPGGGLVPPGYVPGVVQKLFEPLSVVDLIPQIPTPASQVRVIVEGTATSGAAAVAETATKPESSLGFSEVSEPIRKIATILPVSDEMLEDGPSIQTYLNGRLNLFVAIEEERQVLRGAGASSNELVGIFERSDLLTYARGTADSNAVAILKCAAGFRGSVHLDADILVLHPDNALATRLLTDSTGQFLGGGPYVGQYGAGAVVPMLNAPLWGMRVAISSTVGKGTALLGSSQAVQIFRRGGRSVEASNSHASFFAQNLTALRCEERLGLAVLRPFVQITGLS